MSFSLCHRVHQQSTDTDSSYMHLSRSCIISALCLLFPYQLVAHLHASSWLMTAPSRQPPIRELDDFARIDMPCAWDIPSNISDLQHTRIHCRMRSPTT